MSEFRANEKYKISKKERERILENLKGKTSSENWQSSKDNINIDRRRVYRLD
jgi:hypothetical protein